MRVCIRADASPAIGAGHIMRCLSLARCLVGRGAAVDFVTANLSAALESQVLAAGCVVQRLSGTASTDDAPSPLVISSDDPTLTMSAIGANGCDWLVVDHYGIDRLWLERAGVCAGRVMVIDDNANRELIADLVLNQNLGADRGWYDGLLPEATTLLAGPRYALLRDEFPLLRPAALAKRRRFGGLGRIMVSFGYSDPKNLTVPVINALSTMTWDKPPRLEVILGSGAPGLEQVRAACSASPLNCDLVIDATDMGSRMLGADLVLGTPGTTSWERCCLGVPSVTAWVADNQRKNSKHLAQAGATIDLGEWGGLSAESVQIAVESLNNAGAWEKMASAALSCCDGGGVMRVVEVMASAGKMPAVPAERQASDFWRVRGVEQGDSDDVLKWRNDHRTRAMSLSGEAVSLDAHRSFFARVLNCDDIDMGIACMGGDKIGMVRFDRLPSGKFEVGINLNPSVRGRGLAAPMLRAGIDWHAAKHGSVSLLARIKTANIASVKVFTRVGFKFLSIDGDVLSYRREES